LPRMPWCWTCRGRPVGAEDQGAGTPLPPPPSPQPVLVRLLLHWPWLRQGRAMGTVALLEPLCPLSLLGRRLVAAAPA
jgi:hypothetical protein